MAAREMGGLLLEDALSLCELMASLDPERYDRAALHWLQQFIDASNPRTGGDKTKPTAPTGKPKQRRDGINT
jgi:hypothetical protein